MEREFQNQEMLSQSPLSMHVNLVAKNLILFVLYSELVANFNYKSYMCK